MFYIITGEMFAASCFNRKVNENLHQKGWQLSSSSLGVNLHLLYSVTMFVQAVNGYADAQSRPSVRSSPQRKVPKFACACSVTRGLVLYFVWANSNLRRSLVVCFISDLMCERQRSLRRFKFLKSKYFRWKIKKK